MVDLYDIMGKLHNCYDFYCECQRQSKTVFYYVIGKCRGCWGSSYTVVLDVFFDEKSALDRLSILKALL